METGPLCVNRRDYSVSGIDARAETLHSVCMNETFSRPDWDRYFMNIADVVATRGNCIRRKVAAVVVKDNRIVSTGYNGTPPGVPNCCDGGCARCAGDSPSGSDLGDCICAHAEENAITQAALHGISLKGSTLYSTLNPCLICARMIISSGIREVIYRDEYEFDLQTKTLFEQAGVKLRRFE